VETRRLFSSKDAYFLVSQELQVVPTTVPAIHGDKGGTKAPPPYLPAHLLKVIILGLTLTVAIHPEVHRHTDTCCIGVMKHNQINAFHLLVVQTTPKIPHQFCVRRIAKGLINHHIINAQRATLKLNGSTDFIKKIFAAKVAVTKKAIDFVMADGKYL
jgi:hypothetical protein